MSKIQIILDMQNPKTPGIKVGLEGRLLRWLKPRIEVVLHKGGNSYSLPELKKGVRDGL